MRAVKAVTIGVGDLDAALELWHGHMGHEIVARCDGAAQSLARHWRLAPGCIRRQCVLRVPGSNSGWLHLLEFETAAAAVRDGAESFDLCPKNLDVYVSDIAARIRGLRAAGWTFSAERHTELAAPDGTRFREIHMPVHDAINVVLLELPGRVLPLTERGFGGVGPLILTVADAEREAAFFERIFGLELLSHNRLDGPHVEAMVGLPRGAGLDVRILGDASLPLGLVELVSYSGTHGRDLYPRTRLPAAGILRATFHVDQLDPVRRALDELHYDFRVSAHVSLPFAGGACLALRSPTGLGIDVLSSA